MENLDFFKITSIVNFTMITGLILTKLFKKDNLKNWNSNEEIEPLKLKKKKNIKKIYKESLRNIISDEKELKPIIKICLTGGPCAGKTTSMALLVKKFTSYGYNVIIVPEIATLTVEAGGCIIVGDKPTNYAIERQSEIIKMIIKMEDYYYDLCKNKNDKPTILLCDRGCLDGKAYVNEDLWQSILDENNWDDIKLSHKRYNAIIHLVTAADGKKKYYALENNLARSEGITMAIDIDRKIQNCYAGHPKHIIIRNSIHESFNDKINWVFEEVSGLIGLNINHKFSGNIQKSIFILKSPIKFDLLDISTTVIYIKKIILTNIITEKNNKIIEKKERFLSIQSLNNNNNYYLNINKIMENEEKIRNHRKINTKEYVLYKKQNSDYHYNIYYKRTVFIINKKVYMQDEIELKDKENSKPIYLLKRQNLKDFCCDDIEELPEEIVELIIKKVENNEEYNEWNFSKK